MSATVELELLQPAQEYSIEHARVKDELFLPKEDFVTQLFYLATFDQNGQKSPIHATHLSGLKRYCGCAKNSSVMQRIARHACWVVPSSMVGLAASAYFLYRRLLNHSISQEKPILFLTIGCAGVLVGSIGSIFSVHHPKNDSYTEQKKAIKKTYRKLTEHLVRLKTDDAKLAEFLSTKMPFERLKLAFEAAGLGPKSSQAIVTDLQAACHYILENAIDPNCSNDLQDFIKAQQASPPSP